MGKPEPRRYKGVVIHVAGRECWILVTPEPGGFWAHVYEWLGEEVVMDGFTRHWTLDAHGPTKDEALALAERAVRWKWGMSWPG